MRSKAAVTHGVNVLFAAVVICALSIAGSAHQGPQQPPGVVTIQTLNVRDILYVLSAGGGNALALMRDDGVVLIDSKLPGWGAAVRDTLAAVTDKPVVMIINTHAHPDHTGGNVDFPTATQIVAHQN